MYLLSSDFVGACWVSLASPHAAAAAAHSHMDGPLGISEGWLGRFPWMVMAMPQLA